MTLSPLRLTKLEFGLKCYNIVGELEKKPFEPKTQSELREIHKCHHDSLKPKHIARISARVMKFMTTSNLNVEGRTPLVDESEGHIVPLVKYC